MSLPQCPNGCISDYHSTTVIQHQSSDGINEFWCASCKLCWDNPDAPPPIRKNDRPSPFKEVSQRHHKNG